jgi:hypothetical protein
VPVAVATLDHLVVAAATLEQGEDHLERLLGVRPQRGGKHVAMGTHNSLLRLGDRAYLEVMAIDPEATPPKRPRWFALDSAAMREALAEAPRLIHWVARTDDLDAARRACAIDPGPAQSMERGAFRWRITIPDDGHLPGDGIVPSLVQWPDARHPADTMQQSGVRLAALSAAHPEPARIRSALERLSLGETLKVTFGTPLRLAAMLQTPRGPVTL